MTYPNIPGVRAKYESIRKQFQPRRTDDIPRGESQRNIPEAFLADALATISVLCDRIEVLEGEK